MQSMSVDPEHTTVLKPLTHPLMPCQRAEPRDCGGTKPACAADGDSSFSWMSAFVFFILAVNCSAAVYHSRHDPWSVAFVVASFLILVSLVCALRVFETLPRGSPRRAHVRATVWVLSTALTLMFSQRVAALMPFPAAVLVWVMAVSTICSGFFMFFVCPDGAATLEKEPAKVPDIPQRPAPATGWRNPCGVVGTEAPPVGPRYIGGITRVAPLSRQETARLATSVIRTCNFSYFYRHIASL